jgi:hypothetical protein
VRTGDFRGSATIGPGQNTGWSRELTGKMVKMKRVQFPETAKHMRKKNTKKIHL